MKKGAIYYAKEEKKTMPLVSCISLMPAHIVGVGVGTKRAT